MKNSKYPVDTLDDKRTYAADIDMKGDPAALARKPSLDGQGKDRDPEGDAADGLAAAAGQNGQT